MNTHEASKRAVLELFTRRAAEDLTDREMEFVARKMVELGHWEDHGDGTFSPVDR